MPDTAKKQKADIVVCGGGPAGCGAAISAARAGKDVILIERYGFLGGMATAGLVHPWMTYLTGNKPVVAGIFQEIVDELKKVNAYKDSSHFGNVHHCFDPEILKFILMEMCLSSGARLLLHTFVVSARKTKNSLVSITCESKSGTEEIRAKIFIDATGDADIVDRAGLKYEKGRKKDGLMQPMTLHFRMGGVNTKRMLSRDAINKIYNKAKQKGKINNPRENLLWFDTTRDDEIHFNTTRIVKVDGTNRDDLTRAEIEGRRQTMELVRFLKEAVPGFEDSYLISTAPQVGVRETRRIAGHYVLNGRDIIKGRKFPDGIACGSYGIDIHNPSGTGTHFQMLPKGLYYNIPYRSLIPLGADNLLVAGRPISTTHEAHSSTRIQAICYATGQAAGTAAALCVEHKKRAQELDIAMLQKELLAQNAIIF